MREGSQRGLGCRIGIDLGGTKIAGVLLDENGQLQAHHQIPTPQGKYQATVAAVVSLVKWLQTQVELGDDQDDSIPVGIGTPGVCLQSTGLMANCNSTCLNHQPLLADLCALLGPRVSLANDADCFALSEWRYRQSLLAQQTLFGIILGTGVGAGIVHGGRLLNGPNSLAGEWGHMPLPYFQTPASAQVSTDALELRLGSRTCYCGRVNCIETFLSGPGLAVTHQTLWQEQYSPQELAAAWRDEPLAASATNPAVARANATLNLYLDMLARSLAQVINLLDPRVIVVGGGLSSMEFIYTQLPQRVPRYLFARHTCETQFLPPQGGAASGVFGAAWLGEPVA